MSTLSLWAVRASDGAVVTYFGHGRYELVWWPKNRVRSPNASVRQATRVSAERFAKRHDIVLPKEN